MLDLPLLVVEFLQRLVPAPVSAEDLQLGLLDLDRERLHLVHPLDGAALPARLRHVHPRGGALDVGDRLHDPADRLEQVGQLGAGRDRGAARHRPDEGVGNDVHDLACGLDHVGAGAGHQGVHGEVQVLDLVVEQAVLVEARRSRAGWPGWRPWSAAAPGPASRRRATGPAGWRCPGRASRVPARRGWRPGTPRRPCRRRTAARRPARGPARPVRWPWRSGTGTGTGWAARTTRPRRRSPPRTGQARRRAARRRSRACPGRGARCGSATRPGTGGSGPDGRR